MQERLAVHQDYFLGPVLGSTNDLIGRVFPEDMPH